jgi:hypothetical protein
MLPDYGVVVGDFTNYTTQQGQWYHVDMNIQAGDSVYQAAVDVNEVNGRFQYQIFNNLDLSLFTTVSGQKSHWGQPFTYDFNLSRSIGVSLKVASNDSRFCR